jgi:putative acetyltransferase
LENIAEIKIIRIIRTTTDNHDFRELVKLLDAGLAITDGEDHSFYSQFNSLASIKHVVMAYDGNKAVGCGAMKKYNADTMEIKRMYVLPGNRKRGIATKVLTELELWAVELSYTKCILETGIKQPEAIAFYKKAGYKLIQNFGQYSGVDTSVCFEKVLT